MEESRSAFAGRRDVRHAEIRLPAGAPAWMADRARLWAAVEAAEKRKDARLAKEIEFALPRDLPRAMWLVVAREMADAYTARGHVVDLAIHDDDTAHNPHVHLLLTTRQLLGDGFGPKIREADGVAFVRDARARWEKTANAALGKVGSGIRLDARSHAARGIERTPGVHRGPDPLERRAKREERARMSLPLDHDMMEARRELLADKRVLERFPLLSARPDWPPESRQAPGGLSFAEREEFRAFWREVNRRMLGEPERAPSDFEPSRSLDDRMSQIYERVADAERRTGEDRRAAFAAAAPLIREMQANIQKEMVAAGILREDSVMRWSEIERMFRNDQLDRELAQARAREAILTEPSREPKPTRADHERMARLDAQELERGSFAFEPNDRHLPVPDPNGDAISPQQRDRAEAEVLRDMQAPARSQIGAPRPERAPEDEREAAREALDRQARLPVSEREAEAYRLAPHEDRLDWLNDDRDTPQPKPEHHDDRLGWLDQDISHDRRREPERERERERDRER